MTQRRLAVLGALTLATSAIKVIEDVLARESGPVDTALLWLYATVCLPLAAVMAVVATLVCRRRFEALLMGASMVTVTLLM